MALTAAQLQKQSTAQAAKQSLILARNAASAARIQAKNQRHSAAVAAHVAAIQAKTNAKAQKLADKQAILNAKNNPFTPQNPSDQLQGIQSQPVIPVDTSLNTPNQATVDGGNSGLSSGTNSTGGVTLGGDPSADPVVVSKGLTTTEYAAIGLLAVVVIYMVAKHKKAA